MSQFETDFNFWISIAASILFIISEILAYSKCPDHGVIQVLISFSKRLIGIQNPTQLVEAIEQEVIADIPS